MGHAVFGRYRLIAELGHGGMADVFLAVQAGPAGSRFRKLSVIKRLRQNLAEDPEFIAMLLEEARIASRLNHPNVVQTNEVSAVDDQYYIAMEFLDGQPLHRVQHRLTARARAAGTRVDWPTTRALVVALMDALAGLHHAHDLLDYDGEALQIVHRDVTPQNIFVTYTGQVKVVDFGVAKAAGRAAETRQGIVKGKVRYMAPEHAAGKAIDRRADVFAVGILLWETLTGRRLWKDMDDLVIVQHLVYRTPLRRPREIDPTVPESLERVCMRALAFDPSERYPTADAMRIDLEQALADSGELIAARRALARLVPSLFEDKRAEMKTIIEQQLAELEAVGSGDFEVARMGRSSPSFPVASLTPTPPPGALAPNGTAIMNPGRLGLERPPPTSSLAPLSALPSPAPLPGDIGDRPSGAPGRSTAPESSLPPGVASRRKRRESEQRTRSGLLALTLVMCGIAMALAVVILTRRGSQPAAAAALPPPTHDAPHLEQVTVRLDASPKDARISIDDGPFEEVPVVMRVVKDERDHRIRIEASGYEPQDDTISFANDLTAVFALEKTAPSSPLVSRAAPPMRRSANASTAAGEQNTEPRPPVAAAPQNATAPASSEYVMPSGRPPKYERLNTKLDHNDPWK